MRGERAVLLQTQGYVLISLLQKRRFQTSLGTAYPRVERQDPRNRVCHVSNGEYIQLPQISSDFHFSASPVLYPPFCSVPLPSGVACFPR